MRCKTRPERQGVDYGLMPIQCHLGNGGMAPNRLIYFRPC